MGGSKSTITLRSGFSKWDLLIILGLLSVLAALAVPLLNRDRGDARRDACVENLRAIGVALTAYHDAHKMLPPAAFTTAAFNDDEFHRRPVDINSPAAYSWPIMLLTYLGEEQLASQVDLSVQLTHERNAKARTTHLARMSCPADEFNTPDNLYLRRLLKYPAVQFARGNYAMNQGTKYTSTCIMWEGEVGDYPGNLVQPVINGLIKRSWGFNLKTEILGDGVSDFNRSNRFRDFSNGIGNIVAIEEIRSGLIPADSRGTWAFGYVGGNITAGHGLWGDDAGPNARGPRADDVIGCGELHNVHPRKELRKMGMPCCWYLDAPYQATARSMHGGGANVLTLDGAAHFITDDVDLNVWHALHSRESAPLTGSLAQKNLALASSEPAVLQHRASMLPKDAAKSLKNSIGMSFTRIPAGEFVMGQTDLNVRASKLYPPHPVRISRPFYMATYEVTQQNYKQVMDDNPSFNQNRMYDEGVEGYVDTSQYPVEQVSWDNAVEFCKRLSELPGEAEAGRKYRLPTEAEWEFACRGGQTEPPEHPKDAGQAGDPAVKPVGSFEPNGYGLYDMRENIWEWCADWFNVKYYKQSPKDDPPGPSSGVLKVVRGRDWVYGAHFGCKIVRDPSPPTRVHPLLGFRVVCEFAPPNR